MSSCRASLVLAVALAALLPDPAPAEPPGAKGSAPAEARHTDRYGDPLPDGALARLGSLRWRAGAQVDWLTWAPDGKVLAAVADGDVCLFDVATGKLTRRIRAMAWPAERAAFAPDGKRLLIWSTLYLGKGYRRKALHVWDLLAGRPVLKHRPKGEYDNGWGVQWVGWSAEGRPLAVSLVGQGPAGIRLRDLSDGRETEFDAGEVENHPGEERWAYAAGAKLLAVPDEHGVIHVWDAATGAARGNLKAQDAYVCGLALSPDGHLLASLARPAPWTDEGVVELWDVGAGKVKFTFPFAGVEGRGGALGFTPDGKTLVAVLPAQEAHFWDVNTGRERGRTPALRTGLTTSLAFSPDGKTLATAEGWGAIHLWDAGTGAPQPEKVGPSGWARRAEFSPDGRQLATGSTDGTVSLWDAQTEDLLAQVRRPGRRLGTWAFSADGRSLYSSWDDNQVYLSDTATGRPLQVLTVEDPGRPAPRQQDVNLALSGDGSALVTLSACGPPLPTEVDPKELLVTGWDPATRKRLFQRRRPCPDFQVTVVTADGRILAAQNRRVDEEESRGRGAIRLEDMATGREVVSLPPVPDAETWPLAFSPDGRLFAAVSYGPAPDEKGSGDDVELLRLWEVVSATKVLARRIDSALHVDFSPESEPLLAFRPDGRLLALPASRREILLWDLRRGRESRRMRGLAADLTGLAFSPDGRRLVTGLCDSTSLVWDVAGTRQAGVQDLLGPDGVARAWGDLAAGAPRAFAARGRLADSPGQAVPLLKQHLRPVEPADADQLRRLIADLDSDTFAVREDASKRLEELGESAEGALRRALADRPSPEACRRIGRLLEALRGPVTRPEALRSLRALAVLEDIGTPEARQALDRVAQGAPEARLTREAKASLERLARRPPPER
jgi:WD40 repeat protein